MDGHRKCTGFLFYLSSHYHIYIFKSLFTSTDDYFENLGETNVLACKMFTSGYRPWLKNVACLSSLTSPVPALNKFWRLSKRSFSELSGVGKKGSSIVSSNTSISNGEYAPKRERLIEGLQIFAPILHVVSYFIPKRP